MVKGETGETMLNLLQVIQVSSPIRVNGENFLNSEEAYQSFKDYDGELTIEIPHVRNQVEPTKSVNSKQLLSDFGSSVGKTYKIQVRKYMTQKSSPEFDFMAKWNDNKPMPLVVMTGTVLEETPGMYKMSLYVVPEPSTQCMACGRKLTHPVSLMYGIGPECGSHHHISPYSKEELDDYLANVKQQMSQITWTGWVIKKAITQMLELKEDK